MKWLITRWYLYAFSFLSTLVLTDYRGHGIGFFLGSWSAYLIMLALFFTIFIFINESYQKYKSTSE